MAPPSILIVGCGVAGPTLASYLLLNPLPPKQKPQITVLERASSLRAQGQNVDIRGTGVAILRKLRLEYAVRSAVTGEEGAQLVDSQNRIWAAFAADKSGKVQTGTSDIEILRGRLAEICYKRSASISDEVKKEGGTGIEYIFGDYLNSLEQDEKKVHVRFAKSGKKRSFDMVVGADGLQSLTRKLTFGEQDDRDRVVPTGMYGSFYSMPSAETDSIWRRWYHAPGRKGAMIRPSDRKERTTVFMYVINEEDRRFKDVAALGYKGAQSQKALMREYWEKAGWESERLVREMDAADDFYYDAVAQIKMDKWSKGRVVLLGDAGYCASPLSGMGTTLGLNGAYNLAGAILRHLDDHTAAFEEYEMKMRPMTEKAQILPFGGPKPINPETAWGIWILLLISAFLQRSGLVKLLFIILAKPVNVVPVEDYGFRQLPEWRD